MPDWLSLDWHKMFVPSQPILETILRGIVTYLSIFALLRLFRRQTGSVGPADLLVLILVADASQNAMAGEYQSITDGLILVITIVICEFVLDWLNFHSPLFARILSRPPIVVIENGRINDTNLSNSLLTRDELLSHLREKGVDNLSYVKRSYVEGDGRISVISNERATAANSDDVDRSVGG
jgi:uncharacterized membrane protein YcaP (DUF421 family)